MGFSDKTLSCSACGANFTFTASEQEFFQQKGFTNEPKRCPECRASRKQRSVGHSDSGNRGYRSRTMHPATCASCGKSCEVPFEPRGQQPVYCSDCYKTARR